MGWFLFFVTDISVVLFSYVDTGDGNIQWWFIGSRLSYIVVMYHITNGCTELVSYILEMFRTRCEGLYWIPQVTYDGTDSYWIEWSNDGNY